MTTTLVTGFLRSRCKSLSMTPTQKATVFPLPVLDEATMSCPSMAMGMHSRWMGVGVVSWREARERRRGRERVQLGRVLKDVEVEVEAWEVK